MTTYKVPGDSPPRPWQKEMLRIEHINGLPHFSA